jgi:hypothetical protein
VFEPTFEESTSIFTSKLSSATWGLSNRSCHI